MKNECLITSLKGAVSDESLEFFDAVQFRLKISEYDGGLVLYSASSGFLFGGVGVKIRILSNGYIDANGVNKGVEFTFPEGYATSSKIVAYNPNEYTEFVLFGLDKIERLWCSYENVPSFQIKNPDILKHVNPNAFFYSDSNLSSIVRYMSYDGGYNDTYLNHLGIDVSKVETVRNIGAINSWNGDVTKTSDWSAWIGLTSITYYYYIAEGDIYYLGNLVNLTSINLRKPGITGDISSLGKLTKLASLNVSDSRVSGSIESFVAAQYDNGRTNGSVKLLCNSSSDITYNGSKVTGTRTILWADRTTITIS